MTVAVIGGGIIGTAVAHRITQVDPSAEVVLYEKEDRLGRHQSGHNSGVLHAGVYYPPGSLKATLCRRGVGLMREFAREHAIPIEDCGKLIVATTDEEVARLADLEQRSRTNGVPGIERLGPEGLRDVEPAVAGLAGLRSPSTAIIDFVAVVEALGRDLEAAGGRVRLGREVTGIEQSPRGVRITSRDHDGEVDEEEVDAVIACPGLQADRVARLAGVPDDLRIIPFLGEYLTLRPSAHALVRGLIYPVPDPRYPFLGVHLTRHIGGDVLVGPNAVLAWGREAYRRGDARSTEGPRLGHPGPSPRDLAEIASWPGAWRMGAAHWRTGITEMAGSLVRRRFVAQAQRYVPQLTMQDVEPGPAGIRAQAIDRRGELVDDFAITVRGPVVAVRNAPSPGATSSLAIAEHIVEKAQSAELIAGRPASRAEPDR